MSEKYDEMLALVKNYHAGQSRSNGRVPYWTHCERVALMLKSLLAKSQEGTDGQQETLFIAALGHDLYEDTSVTREEIVSKFDQEVDELIEQVTNRFGDDQAAKYAQQMAKASEAALLIKFADLCENYWSVSYAIPDNGLELSSKIASILDAQWPALKDCKFREFPKTASWLAEGIDLGQQQLATALAQQTVM